MHYFERVNRTSVAVYNQFGQRIADAYKFTDLELDDDVVNSIYDDHKLPIIFFEKQGKRRRFIVLYESSLFDLYCARKSTMPTARLNLRHFSFMHEELNNALDILFPNHVKVTVSFQPPVKIDRL